MSIRKYLDMRLGEGVDGWVLDLQELEFRQ